MKRIASLALLALLLALKSPAQQTTVTTNSAYLDAVISRCALADWPTNDPVCLPFIIATGKSVLNLSRQATQPVTVDPGTLPAVPVPTVPTPAPAPVSTAPISDPASPTIPAPAAATAQ